MANDQTRIHVGKRRRDGKYPVQFVFPISGRRLNKLLTKEQIDEEIISQRRGGLDPIVTGYQAPPKTKQELEADIAEALERRGS